MFRRHCSNNLINNVQQPADTDVLVFLHNTLLLSIQFHLVMLLTSSSDTS